jgi:hypothetical protein
LPDRHRRRPRQPGTGRHGREKNDPDSLHFQTSLKSHTGARGI